MISIVPPAASITARAWAARSLGLSTMASQASDVYVKNSAYFGMVPPFVSPRVRFQRGRHSSFLPPLTCGQAAPRALHRDEPRSTPRSAHNPASSSVPSAEREPAVGVTPALCLHVTAP